MNSLFAIIIVISVCLHPLSLPMSTVSINNYMFNLMRLPFFKLFSAMMCRLYRIIGSYVQHTVSTVHWNVCANTEEIHWTCPFASVVATCRSAAQRSATVNCLKIALDISLRPDLNVNYAHEDVERFSVGTQLVDPLYNVCIRSSSLLSSIYFLFVTKSAVSCAANERIS